MDRLATAFVIYIGICGLVWAGFVRLEPLLKKDTREKIASWVSGSKHGDADNRWPATFGVFDIAAHDVFFAVELPCKRHGGQEFAAG